MNIGVFKAKDDIIIRLDVRAFFLENCFSELVKNLVELGTDNVGGVCRSIINVLNSNFVMGSSYFRVRTNDEMKVDTILFGCFHCEFFDRIGYFEEKLMATNITNLTDVLLRTEARFTCCPN